MKKVAEEQTFPVAICHSWNIYVYSFTPSLSNK